SCILSLLFHQSSAWIGTAGRQSGSERSGTDSLALSSGGYLVLCVTHRRSVSRSGATSPRGIGEGNGSHEWMTAALIAVTSVLRGLWLLVAGRPKTLLRV